MLYTNNKHKLMDFKISCLLFIRNQENKLLLLKRKKTPNKGLWSPPGGKLLTEIGESPVECAKREAGEETGLHLSDNDLSLFGYVSEKGYENSCNWLMFLFACNKTINNKPKDFAEGSFKFFERGVETLSASTAKVVNAPVILWVWVSSSWASAINFSLIVSSPSNALIHGIFTE